MNQKFALVQIFLTFFVLHFFSGLDACRTYFCDPTLNGGSCTSSAKSFPAHVNCTFWTCNSTDNSGNPFVLHPTVCSGPDKCNPAFCENSTDSCVISPIVCNDIQNQCDLTTCNTTTGLCNAKNYFACSQPNCKACQLHKRSLIFLG